MSRAACRTGLLIIFLVPMGALGRVASPEAGLASASVQRVPIPDRSAVMPILDCAKLVQHDFSTVAEAPTRVQSAATEAATAERAEFCFERLRRANDSIRTAAAHDAVDRTVSARGMRRQLRSHPERRGASPRYSNRVRRQAR